jgi:hypothetical protein
MNTTTSDPEVPGEPPGPRQSYSTCLFQNIMRLLAADDCEIVITAENVGLTVRAAGDLPRAFGIEPGHGGAVTLTLPQAGPLSGDQRRAVEHARDFLHAAAAGPHTLAAHLDAGALDDTALFYATSGFGAAIVQLRDLLAILDEVAPTQPPGMAGGGPMTAPHAYIPAGPVEAAPYHGYCPPEVRREAFAAVLDGVETGAYDLRIVAWLTQWDDTTCRTIASLLWRCRLAGRKEDGR